MDFEQCEIKSTPRGTLNREFQFRAEVMGPDGIYTTALSRWVPSEEFNLKNTLFMPSSGYYEPDDTVYHRKFLNELTNHLVRTSWEPLPQSGAYWYSLKFRRAAVYLPDLRPSTPYTIGDREEWGKTVEKYHKFSGTKDARYYSAFAEADIMLGITLEREHSFDEAYNAYIGASVLFATIAAEKDAENARYLAKRVINFRPSTGKNP